MGKQPSDLLQFCDQPSIYILGDKLVLCLLSTEVKIDAKKTLYLLVVGGEHSFFLFAGSKVRSNIVMCNADNGFLYDFLGIFTYCLVYLVFIWCQLVLCSGVVALP